MQLRDGHLFHHITTYTFNGHFTETASVSLHQPLVYVERALYLILQEP